VVVSGRGDGGRPQHHEVAGVLTPGCGLLHLAPDPGSGRVTGHVEVEQAAAIVADHEEDVGGLEGGVSGPRTGPQPRSPERGWRGRYASLDWAVRLARAAGGGGWSGR